MIVWRVALLHRGWTRRTQRYRLSTRPLSPSHINREEALKPQGWTQQRAWSQSSSGGLLHVIGAVQYGTSKVFSKIVPHFDAQDLRQYIHQGIALFRPTKQELVMVVDRSGSHRAPKLDAPLGQSHGTCRFHCFPARCGPHLNPIAGFWRAMKEAIGAGRGVSDLQRLYKRTRHVLMAHQEQPI